MLNKAFDNKNLEGLILHSDQGWQYQMAKNISIKIQIELILAIDDYINYYNYDRIKVKLKGLSRLQSFNQILFINCPTFGVQFSGDYFIFGGISPLSPTSIKRHKHNACVSSNVREIKTHEFRHSYATRKIKCKVPVEKVSKLLGHSSISITLDIYVHNEKKKVI